MSDQEKQAIIKAIKAIASALLLCETDARFAMNRRIDDVYDAINELNVAMDGVECVWNEQTGTFHCSSCDTLLTNEVVIEWSSHKVMPITLLNYCPKCGAKVRKAVER